VFDKKKYLPYLSFSITSRDSLDGYLYDENLHARTRSMKGSVAI
jgi:hypothetical protein